MVWDFLLAAVEINTFKVWVPVFMLPPRPTVSSITDGNAESLQALNFLCRVLQIMKLGQSLIVLMSLSFLISAGICISAVAATAGINCRNVHGGPVASGAHCLGLGIRLGVWYCELSQKDEFSLLLLLVTPGVWLSLGF